MARVSRFSAVLAVAMCGLGAAAAFAEEPSSVEVSIEAQAAEGFPSSLALAELPQWGHDYGEAMRAAKAAGRMLLIYFYDPSETTVRNAFINNSLADERITTKLAEYELLALPTTAEVPLNGRSVRLLGHGAFAEMLGRQGIAIVDQRGGENPYFGYVVSVYPFYPGRYMGADRLSVMLNLPEGTLTQRTLVFAVRIHPEAPASTEGECCRVLEEYARRSSQHMADITLQGHHNWESRFHEINAQLPGGLTSQEVCAESWPGESLVDAAIECVDSWRHSPGHWSAVRSRSDRFGYDMKRGRNGIWYATGIFGRRR